VDGLVIVAAVFVMLCVVNSVIGAAAWRWPKSDRLNGLTHGLGLASLLWAVGMWAARWWIVGHLPLFGTFESSLSLAVFVLIATMLVKRRNSSRAAVWFFSSLVSAGLVAHGLLYDRSGYALTISERSWVVDVHSILAWAAFGALTVSAGLAIFILPGKRSVAAVERLLPWTLSLGFLLHTAMLASGSFYKFLLFGKAWSFDPIETLGFVAWISYGTLLHMHLFAGWEGRRLARWNLGLFLILLVSYRGIVYFPAWSTYHIFDMDLRMHLMENNQTAQGGDQ
jgi:ABC-type transport system involved in cytochrome c biogenesis permease subunit